MSVEKLRIDTPYIIDGCHISYAWHRKDKCWYAGEMYPIDTKNVPTEVIQKFCEDQTQTSFSKDNDFFSVMDDYDVEIDDENII